MLILSTKAEHAQKIAEILPNTKAKGRICQSQSEDLQAAKTAVGLVNATAFIIPAFWAGFLAGSIVSIFVLCSLITTYQFGQQIGIHLHSMTVNQQQR